MCTNYEKSYHIVLSQFNENKAVTKREVLDRLANQILSLALYGSTIRDFIDELEVGGYITKKSVHSTGASSLNTGLVLTADGRAELSELQELVDKAATEKKSFVSTHCAPS
ncbi:MAG: hypothetical protein AB2826_19525 [Candidatus Thiodiazotropha sp.]